jgi:beta-lactamase class A
MNALTEVVEQIELRWNDVRWSIEVLDDVGASRASLNRDLLCETASVGKLLLLIEAATQIADGRLSSTETLARTSEVAAHDSGVWQHLQIDELSVSDCISLIAASSDNLATNVLLARVGPEAVSGCGRRLGLTATSLNDYVRDVRTAAHPAALSVGTARELAELMWRLQSGEVVSDHISRQVLNWLSLNVDLSMVASALRLDPLAHVEPDRGLTLHNKTGTTDGVRCDVGVMTGPAGTVSYAVLANWQRRDERDALRDDVMDAMGRLGQAIRAFMT